MQLSLLLPSNLRKGVFDDHLFHSQMAGETVPVKNCK